VAETFFLVLAEKMPRSRPKKRMSPGINWMAMIAARKARKAIVKKPGPVYSAPAAA
jgi:hypothetical protein